ncbi:MAG: hypothetical protein DRP20_05015 [Thermotogae bacterium]|nr:MAG: hypothetical protein DRP20_05015 [Thermotogota bacterium]
MKKYKGLKYAKGENTLFFSVRNVLIEVAIDGISYRSFVIIENDDKGDTTMISEYAQRRADVIAKEVFPEIGRENIKRLYNEHKIDCFAGRIGDENVLFNRVNLPAMAIKKYYDELSDGVLDEILKKAAHFYLVSEEELTEALQDFTNDSKTELSIKKDLPKKIKECFS